VVEEGPVADIFANPCHGYTKGLLKSVPVPGGNNGQRSRTLYEMTGIIPSLFRLPGGCLFHPRCPGAKSVCKEETPPWRTVSPGHGVLCWDYE
jgi:peptide/nickel transport system ATP-binding protein